MSKAMEKTRREQDLALLRDVLDDRHDLREDERAAFADMLDLMMTADREALSPKQRDWARRVLDRFQPAYENLVSSGKVPRGREVETLPMLRREALPMRPPGRRA